MENKHLTEENIQAIILKEIVDENIKVHLFQCTICNEKYREYKTLISRIETLQPEAFVFNVTAMVMQKIEATETKKATEKNNLLYAIIGLFCIGIFIILLPFLNPIFLYFFKLTVFENGLIFITVFGITTYLLNDTFREYKKNRTLLFE